MSSRRPHSLALCLACAMVVSAGCGGGHSTRAADRPAASGAAPATSTPPPNFDVDHVRTSLLPPKEIAKGIKTQSPTFPGLTEAGVPACSASIVHLPGRPRTLARQLRSNKPGHSAGYTDTSYVQLIAVYPDATAASGAMAKIRGKAKSCPAKRHFPAKRHGKKVIATAHTDTWTATENTVAGWVHLRGFEKLMAPASASKFNVFYDVYDYATRGNVLAASLYWERVAPTAAGQQTADHATTVLTKQLQKIG